MIARINCLSPPKKKKDMEGKKEYAIKKKEKERHEEAKMIWSI
jgi:hypothetical protein